MPKPKISFIVTCLEAAECSVSFEPEGAMHTLREDDEFRVDIIPGDSDPYIEIAYSPRGLSILEASDATVHVRDRAGVDLPL
jgi:hypothetical protein